jgi:hypothetical protein
VDWVIFILSEKTTRTHGKNFPEFEQTKDYTVSIIIVSRFVPTEVFISASAKP